ncbi:MAG: hypothetical protein R3C28_28645 [Pirellulaceae bacterium]
MANVESPTTLALQQMLDLHRPRIWLFGHYHKPWTYSFENTFFCCVPELTAIDVAVSY